jgi:hypothetical protein
MLKHNLLGWGYRPQTEGPGYGSPFARTYVPSWEKESPGVGIRRNGNDDNGNGLRDFNAADSGIQEENDLIEAELQWQPSSTPGVKFYLERSSQNINVWGARNKTDGRLVSGKPENVFEVDSSRSFWVEWATMEPTETQASLELSAWDAVHNKSNVVGTVSFYPFTSVVIVLGGEFQVPADHVLEPGNHGMFRIGIAEYRNGYDVHMYDEDVVDPFDGEGLAYDEVVRAVQWRGVVQVAIMGYSRGGGATYQLAERLHRNTVPGDLTDITNLFAVPYTAYIDAITSYTAGAENRRPLLSAFHCNQYQTNLPLRGGPSGGNDDMDRTNLGVVHGTIDDHATVRRLVRTRLGQIVNR